MTSTAQSTTKQPTPSWPAPVASTVNGTDAVTTAPLTTDHTLRQRVGSATPTDAWLSAVKEMPPLPGAAGTAERMLLLLHYGIAWDGWVGDRRATYWDRLLPDRVVTSTFLAANLRQWWTLVAADLTSAPRGRDERLELEILLREDPSPVLRALREETTPLLLRTRIVTEAVRARTTTSQEIL